MRWSFPTHLFLIAVAASWLPNAVALLAFNANLPMPSLRGGGDKMESDSGPNVFPFVAEDKADSDSGPEPLHDIFPLKGEDSEAFADRIVAESEKWPVDELDSEGNPRQQPYLELRGGADEMPGGNVAVYKNLIVGGGNAAGYVMKGLMEGGAPAGTCCMISAEASLPYERPALSKGYLLGKAPSPMDGGFNCIPEDRYLEHDVELRLLTRVTKVDLKRKLVFTESIRFGEDLRDIVGYDKLCIATGSKTLKLQCPGADLENIFYVRDFADVDRLKQVATSGRKAVVVGGGYIGMEVSACLAIRGLQVTLVSRSGGLLPKLFPPAVSGFFEALWASKGVTVVKEAQVSAVEGKRNATSVQLARASPSSPPLTAGALPCDLVVVGVGAVPNSELFRDSGLELEGENGGIVTDSHLRTNVDAVYAVGDVISFPVEGRDGKRGVQGHVTHARASAQYVARSMVGESVPSEPYQYLPLLYSRVDPWGLCWKFHGHNEGEVRVMGDVDSGEFSALWVKEGRVRGGLHCTLKGEQGAAEEFEALRLVVQAGAAATGLDECTSIVQARAVLT